MTVGELKKALEGIPDDMLVSVESQDDAVVAYAAHVEIPSGSHPGVWDYKNKVRLQGATFWIGAA